MPYRPICCGALLEDGSTCKEVAAVSKVDYVYDRRPLVGDPATYTLKETHYHAICPKCGDRRVIEVQGQTQDPQIEA
jgi:hypothetical protein